MDGIGPGFRGRARTDLSCCAKRAWALVFLGNRKSFAVVVGRPYHIIPALSYEASLVCATNTASSSLTPQHTHSYPRNELGPSLAWQFGSRQTTCSAGMLYFLFHAPPSKPHAPT